MTKVVIAQHCEECNDEAERSNPDKCSIAELGCVVPLRPKGLALPRNDYLKKYLFSTVINDNRCHPGASRRLESGIHKTATKMDPGFKPSLRLRLAPG